MLVQLESFFSECVGVCDEGLLRWLVEASHVCDVAKGQALARVGEEQVQVSFLATGVMRSFFVDREGHEVTDCLIFRPGAPAMPCAQIEGCSPTTVEALTDDVSVVSVDTQRVTELLGSSVAANQLYNRLLQEAWLQHWEVKEAVCQKKALERYLWFLEAYPGLIDLIPNKHIASFLGMTPVTLSRLRTSLRAQAR